MPQSQALSIALPLSSFASLLLNPHDKNGQKFVLPIHSRTEQYADSDSIDSPSTLTEQNRRANFGQLLLTLQHRFPTTVDNNLHACRCREGQGKRNRLLQHCRDNHANHQHETPTPFLSQHDFTYLRNPVDDLGNIELAKAWQTLNHHPGVL